MWPLTSYPRQNKTHVKLPNINIDDTHLKHIVVVKNFRSTELMVLDNSIDQMWHKPVQVYYKAIQ